MNRERRETGAFLAPRGLQDSRETLVLLVHQVLSVQLDLQAYRVLLVLKELRVHRVRLGRRERLVFLDPLVLLVPLATLSTHCHS